MESKNSQNSKLLDQKQKQWPPPDQNSESIIRVILVLGYHMWLWLGTSVTYIVLTTGLQHEGELII